MLFTVICKDKADSLDVRMENRPAHLEFLASLGDKLKAGGPFTDDKDSPIGSMLMIEADDRAEVEALARQDPYAKAGLFQSVEITVWKWLLKNPEG